VILAGFQGVFARCSGRPHLAAEVMNMSMDTFMNLLRKHLSEKDFNRMMEFTASMEPERRAAMMQFLAERNSSGWSPGSD